MADTISSDAPPAASLPQTLRSRPATLVGGILMAIAIVVASWSLGAQQGWNQVGQGGINRTLLPKVGEPAPDLVALDRNGEPVFLSQFRGQPVWLNFWGSWCPPCRSEMPDMEAAYQRLAPQGLVMLAVSLDEPVADAIRYAELNGATYTVVGDPYRQGTAAYPIANFPTHILIDREGIVRDVVLAELNEAQFVERAGAILTPEGSR
jgi:cytochrome c biogenesis protein CcmG, thiol:disulfide interchange protein DsbE